MSKFKSAEIKNILNSLYPETECFLHYKEDWQLLFAVILSAQSTDKKVNETTSVLFTKFPSLADYNPSNLAYIQEIIKPAGLSKSKASYLINTAKILIEEYSSCVIQDRDKLMRLPGVGYKTSGVVLAELYDYPFIPVDTHIYRVSHRLGIVPKSYDPTKSEIALEKFFAKKDCINTHRQLILFGRNICLARNEKCDVCPFKDKCSYYNKKDDLL